MMSRMQALTDTVVVRMQLTGDQETAFRAIMTDQGESMKAIFDEYGGARDPQMREDMMALQQETTEKLGTIFSEEQMAQYQKLLGELRAQMRGGRGPGGPPQG